MTRVFRRGTTVVVREAASLSVQQIIDSRDAAVAARNEAVSAAGTATTAADGAEASRIAAEEAAGQSQSARDDAQVAAAEAEGYAAEAGKPYPDRPAFIAADVPALVVRVGFLVGGRAYFVVRDAAGPIEQANGQKWRPDGAAAPQHFGASGGGSSNDTAPLDALFSYARDEPSARNIIFPTGIYQYAGDGLYVRGQDWSISFEAGAMIFRPSNGKMIVLDAREGIVRRVRIVNPRGYSSVPDGARGDTHVIEFLGDPSNADANATAQEVDIVNPSGSGVESVVHVTRTSYKTWDGIPQLMRWHKISVLNASGDQNNGGQGFPKHIILFDGGTGDHHTFIGGFYRSSGPSVQIGDGVDAVHDTTFTGVHFLGQSGGLYVTGPADPSWYRRNINAVGCQFDGVSEVGARTYRFENLSHFNVTGCNSQVGRVPELINCTAPYIVEDELRNVEMTGGIDVGQLMVKGVPLGIIQSGAFTPTVGFSTPGDQSISYTSQSGFYRRIMGIAYIQIRVAFVITYSTAGGVLLINTPGLPFGIASALGERGGMSLAEASRVTFPSGHLQVVVRPNSANSFRTNFVRSGDVMADGGTAHFPSGGSGVALEFAGWVRIAP